MARGRPYVPIPLIKLQGVRSVDDLGPWVIVDAVPLVGSQAGKVLHRERVYGLKHPTAGTRYACGQCGDTYPTLTAADKHRQRTHPFRKGGARQALVVADQRGVTAVPAAEPEPRQMTFDEVGLDTVGPVLAEGVAAIVASRQGLRDRVRRLETENNELRALLASITKLINDRLGSTE